jgi:hypothetical protein
MNVYKYDSFLLSVIQGQESGSIVSGQSTETSAQVTVNTAFRFSQLTCNVTSNGITNVSVVIVEKNKPGGVVTTAGETPTKMLRESMLALTGFYNREVYGITVSAPPQG